MMMSRMLFSLSKSPFKHMDGHLLLRFDAERKSLLESLNSNICCILCRPRAGGSAFTPIFC